MSSLGSFELLFKPDWLDLANSNNQGAGGNCPQTALELLLCIAEASQPVGQPASRPCCGGRDPIAKLAGDRRESGVDFGSSVPEGSEAALPPAGRT